jgi:hypothetical protein
MKTIKMIITAVITLQAGILFAGNENSSASVSNENSAISVEYLVPVTPKEATFEEAVIINDLTSLAPATPVEATFGDIPAESAFALDLAPVTPAVADFEDVVDFNSLAPVTPAVADFE